MCVREKVGLFLLVLLSLFSRRGGRQLSAGSVRRVQAPVDSVHAERDRVEPFPGGHQRRVERGDEDLRRGRHDDAADARGGLAVAGEQRVEVAHDALDVQGAGQQRLLHGIRGGGEEFLVLLNHGDGG